MTHYYPGPSISLSLYAHQLKLSLRSQPVTTQVDPGAHFVSTCATCEEEGSGVLLPGLLLGGDAWRDLLGDLTGLWDRLHAI